MSSLRELFPEYYDSMFHELSPQELGGHRRWCTFALDANVMLGLYAYSKQTRDDFLRILKGIKHRLWIPHQAALEYEKNRIGRIRAQVLTSETIRNLLSSTTGNIKKEAAKKIAKVGASTQPQHPFLSVGDIYDRLTQVINEIGSELAASEEEYGKLLEDDPIRECLQQITDGRIGDSFNQDELERIYDAGDRRYKRQQPPGYEDAIGNHAKQGIEKFGDLVLWRQLISRGKATKRSVWLITDDMKKDWWRIADGVHAGPRPELVSEMSDKASVRFLMSTSADFYRWAGAYLKKRASDSAIEEARRSAAPSGFDYTTQFILDFQRSLAQLPSVGGMSEIIASLQRDFAAVGTAARLDYSALQDTIAQLRRTAFPEWLSHLVSGSSLASQNELVDEGIDDEREDSRDKDDDAAVGTEVSDTTDVN